MKLQAKSWWRYIFKKQGDIDPDIHPVLRVMDEGYDKIMHDRFFESTYDENKLHSRYNTQHDWGAIHPRNTSQRFSLRNVFIGEELYGTPGSKNLILTTKYDPITLNEFKPWPYNGTKFDNEIPYSCGLIKSKKSYLFGYFRVIAKLPKGNGLWPSIWLTGERSWPPEIDILEGYTTTNPHYKKWGMKNIKLESNLHYIGEDKIKQQLGAQQHPLSLDPTENFIPYSCWWTKDFIRIYHDDFLVREITDKNLLDYFSKEPMKLIINNSVRKEYLPYVSNYSQMVIKEIRIYQSPI